MNRNLFYVCCSKQETRSEKLLAVVENREVSVGEKNNEDEEKIKHREDDVRATSLGK